VVRADRELINRIVQRFRGGLVFKAHRLFYDSTLGLRVIKKREEADREYERVVGAVFYFCFTLVTGPRRSLILKLSDTRVYEPQIRARLGTTAHFCKVVGVGADRE